MSKSNHCLPDMQSSSIRKPGSGWNGSHQNKQPAHCFFEWIYFANVASTLDDRSVYLSRTKLGEELANAERQFGLVDLDHEDTIIVPVPDTSKAAADSMAYELSIPSEKV